MRRLILVLFFAATAVAAHAQSGSIGGSLGKTGKSVSGVVAAPAPTRPPKRQKPVRTVQPPTSPTCADVLTSRPWKWFIGGTTTFMAESNVSGRMSQPLNGGNWRCEGPSTVVLHWNLGGFVDRLSISSDGRRLSGSNNLGHTVTATAQ